jgi:hypothetical protein
MLLSNPKIITIRQVLEAQHMCHTLNTFETSPQQRQKIEILA